MNGIGNILHIITGAQQKSAAVGDNIGKVLCKGACGVYHQEKPALFRRGHDMEHPAPHNTYLTAASVIPQEEYVQKAVPVGCHIIE